jgi:hypothetical protein
MGVHNHTTIYYWQVDPLALVIEDGDLNQIKATATDGAGEYEAALNGEDFTTEKNFMFYKSETTRLSLEIKTDVQPH